MTRARPLPEPEPSFTELLRQALEGFLPSAPGLHMIFDRMERTA